MAVTFRKGKRISDLPRLQQLLGPALTFPDSQFAFLSASSLFQGFYWFENTGFSLIVC